MLASTVQSVADQIATARRGWLGGHKVLIADVADQLGTTVAALAPQLCAWRAAGELELSRADLVGAGDPARVAASEINDGLSSVHLVVTRCYAY